jgi:glucose-1-phosphate cytidylyltransferase
MKVVLFCGGLGMRIRDAENLPKPMVLIGLRPLLWHVMKYYAHYGHKDFILCLGHRADAIKNYFLTYNECLSNDFILSGRRQEPGTDEQRHRRLAHYFRLHRDQFRTSDRD